MRFRTAIKLLLVICAGCVRTKDWTPVYSEVPPPHKEVFDIEEEVTFKFRFTQDHMPNVTDAESNGWHVVTGLPELDNFDEVSNYWKSKGIESAYISNVVYYQQK